MATMMAAMTDADAFATRARTLIGCLKRLQAERDDGPSHSTPSSTLTIHLVGADHREGNSASETLAIFDQLFQYLASVDQRFTTLRLVLVGPNVAQKLHYGTHEFSRTIEGTTLQIALSYYVGSFDDYYAEKDRYVRPDLAVCFNAGVWGYDQWLPTLRLLVHTIRTPLLITSYNENEAGDDEDTLEEEVAVTRWFWRAEKNPSGSKVLRTTQNTIGSVLRENDYWMCVRPDAAGALEESLF